MLKSPQPDYNLPRWLVVGFSGHRHLGENAPAVAKAIREALDKLSLKFPAIAGVSSAASGGDTLFAEEMIRRHAPVSIILPFDCVRFKKDFETEPPDAWPRSQEIIRQSVDRHVVHQLQSELATVFESTLPPEKQKELSRARDTNAYLEATIRTVDCADVLLAVWDGKPGKGPGGTADAVAYARQIGLPVIIITPETAATVEPVEEKMENLVASSVTTTELVTNPREIVEKKFTSLAHLASEHGPKARGFMLWYIYLHLTASTAGAFGIIFGHWFGIPALFAVIELLLLISALALLKNRGAHYQKWLNMRLEAEICRSFLQTWDIRRYPMAEHEPRPAVARQRQLFNSLRFLRQLDKSPLPALEVVRQKYLDGRVDHQIQYFGQQLEISRKSKKWHGSWVRICSNAAAIVVLILLIITTYDTAYDPPILRHWPFSPSVIRLWMTPAFEFLSIFLPLITASASVLLITQDASRRATRYAEMKSALETLKPIVAAAPTREALARAATQVEEELLQELVEWASYVRHTEHLH